jgi:polyisoprenoid-binding protein YceI
MNRIHRVLHVALARWSSGIAVFAVVGLLGIYSAAQQNTLQLDPEQTTVKFTLGDVLHTVHGTFGLKQGAIKFDPVSGQASGEIVVDAASGNSGNGTRDRKMHKEVLESARYPEISFKIDHVDGTVAPQGKSSVQVHGIFRIHGADHEMIAPAQVDMTAGRWSATIHFAVPYVKWGLKNPSTLFLRVSESVEIDMTAQGTVAQP